MKCSYFNDFEKYARDYNGNIVNVKPSKIFNRNVLAADDYCYIGMDHIHSSYENIPCIKIPLNVNPISINFKIHMIRSNFMGYATYEIYKNESRMFLRNIKWDDMDECTIYLGPSQKNDYVEIRYRVDGDISNSVARYLIETNDISHNFDFSLNLETKKWKSKLTNSPLNQNIEPKYYGDGYKY
jgi:hypothetical protein